MGKSRNSRYYRDQFDDSEERNRKVKGKDRHRARQAKQAERNKRLDDREPSYEDDYSY